jgi:undecaprenyl-diphosphatase
MNVDEKWFVQINGWAGQYAVLDWVMFQMSQAGNLWIPGLLLVGYWGWTNWGEAKLTVPCFAFLIVASDLLGAQLKQLIARPRPCQVLTNIHELVGCGGAFSMPSNHAMNSATAISFLVIFYPTLGWVLWPFLGLIGLSRVYLGAHYVSDVLVSFVLGGILGGGVGFLLRSGFLAQKSDGSKEVSPE